MARVLISFLGTGKMKDGDNAKGEYESANYQIDGEDYSAKFIAEALTKAYGIEKVILIGTIKSMWDEVYATFADDDLGDEYKKLQKIRQCVSHESELILKGVDNETGVEIEVPKEVIENVLPGSDSKVVFIKYGLNEAEVDDNISKLLGIEAFLNENDKIYFDITHGFRSLPMVLMNCIIYLQNVSNKKITIEKITYGNLDVSGELGYAPVIDLSKLLNLSDWINGAYAFKEFGKGYQIAKLLGYNPEKDATKKDARGKSIKDFSDVMGSDFLSGIKQQVDVLQAARNSEYSPVAKILVPSVLEEYLHKFSRESSNCKFQYEIAKWHYEHKNYSSATMDILEALLSKVKDICDTTNPEKAKVYLGKKNSIITEDMRLENVKKIKKYIDDKKVEINDPSIGGIEKKLIDFLNFKYSELQARKKQADKNKEYELIQYISDACKIINPKEKNDFELMYSINIFRNSIAHQNELGFCTVDDIIKITGLCIDLLGKLI